eukprot:698533_1
MIVLLLDYAHVDRDSNYNGNGSSNEGIEEVMYSAYRSPPLKRVYLNVIQWIEVKIDRFGGAMHVLTQKGRSFGGTLLNPEEAAGYYDAGNEDLLCRVCLCVIL